MRPFTPEDAEAVFAIFSLPDVGRFTGGVHATVTRSREMIDRALGHQRRLGFSMWAVEERAGGEIVGEVGLQPIGHAGPEIEIGWAFAPGVQGRGYAVEAARAWLDRAFGPLGLEQVVAVIDPENGASRRVAERLGMEKVGRRHVHGADLDLWRISRSAPSPRPS
jgi:ribosomal-protein-alanine N-acetyltransferase